MCREPYVLQVRGYVGSNNYILLAFCCLTLWTKRRKLINKNVKNKKLAVAVLVANVASIESWNAPASQLASDGVPNREGMHTVYILIGWHVFLR